MGGVETADRAAADDADPHGRDVCAIAPHVSGSVPATPSPPRRSGRPRRRAAHPRRSRRGTGAPSSARIRTSLAGESGTSPPPPRPPRRRTAPAVGAPSMQSCWIGSPRWSTTATAMRSAARLRFRDRPVGDRQRPLVLRLRGRRRRVGHPRARARRAAIRRRRSSAARRRRAGPRRGSRARSGRAGPRRWPACRRRSACAGRRLGSRRTGRRSRPRRRCRRRPRRRRLGSASRPRPGTRPRASSATKPRHHRRRDHRRSRPRCTTLGICWVAAIHAFDRARAMPPVPPRSIRDAETSDPACPDDDDRAAYADVLGLVDRATDQRARLGQRQVDCVHNSQLYTAPRDVATAGASTAGRPGVSRRAAALPVRSARSTGRLASRRGGPGRPTPARSAHRLQVRQ